MPRLMRIWRTTEADGFNREADTDQVAAEGQQPTVCGPETKEPEPEYIANTRGDGVRGRGRGGRSVTQPPRRDVARRPSSKQSNSSQRNEKTLIGVRRPRVYPHLPRRGRRRALSFPRSPRGALFPSPAPQGIPRVASACKTLASQPRREGGVLHAP